MRRRARSSGLPAIAGKPRLEDPSGKPRIRGLPEDLTARRGDARRRITYAVKLNEAQAAFLCEKAPTYAECRRHGRYGPSALLRALVRLAMLDARVLDGALAIARKEGGAA